jgi:hypothetical protein
MENFKYTINVGEDKKLAKEVLYLLESMGFKGFRYNPRKSAPWVYVNDLGDIMVCSFKATEDEEITLQELRDMVVLKRNDVGDSNAYCSDNNEHYFITSSGDYYFFFKEKSEWYKSSNDIMFLKENVKPIKEEVMKEFLNPDQSYSLVECCVGKTPIPESWIEVPAGAEAYLINPKVKEFLRNINGGMQRFYNGDWINCLDSHINYIDHDFNQIVWMRCEKESIIDKLVVDDLPEFKHGVDATLAERQAQYGCFEDVAFVTENIMSILSKVRSNGLQDLPHPHRMALYMIASKMARIVNGDFNHKDSWHDIGGYSKLIEDLIGDNNEI